MVGFDDQAIVLIGRGGLQLEQLQFETRNVFNALLGVDVRPFLAVVRTLQNPILRIAFGGIVRRAE